jgi:hypothetical protein
MLEEPRIVEQHNALFCVCLNVAGHWFSPNDPPSLMTRLERIAEEIRALPRCDLVLVQELYTLSVWPLKYAREVKCVLTAPHTGSTQKSSGQRAHFSLLMHDMGLEYHVQCDSVRGFALLSARHQ